MLHNNTPDSIQPKPYPQNIFMEKAELYLNQFSYISANKVRGIHIKHETLGNQAGLCSALSIMLIRAWMIDEQKTYIERYKKFCDMSSEEIIFIANILKTYKTITENTAEQGITYLRTLSHPNVSEYVKNLIQILNDINTLENLLDSTRTNSSKHLQFKKTILDLKEQQIHLIKKLTIETIYLQEKNKNNHTEIESALDFSLEMKIYISSLLFLQNTSQVSLIIEDEEHKIERLAYSHDIFQKIKLIAPDQGMPIHNCLNFAFTFKENAGNNLNNGSDELLQTLKLATHPGDLIYLGNLTKSKHDLIKMRGHATFLLRQASTWLLIDPNEEIEPLPLEDRDLTSEISRQLFTSLGLIKPEGYLPIDFYVFEKNHTESAPRPSIDTLVENICKLRPKHNLNLDAASSFNVSALDLAIKSNNVELAQALMKRNVSTTNSEIQSSITNAMRNTLLSGGMRAHIKRNWKFILLSTFLLAIGIISTIISAGIFPLASLTLAGIFIGVFSLLNITTSVIFVDSLIPPSKNTLSEKKLAPKPINKLKTNNLDYKPDSPTAIFKRLGINSTPDKTLVLENKMENKSQLNKKMSNPIPESTITQTGQRQAKL